MRRPGMWRTGRPPFLVIAIVGIVVLGAVLIAARPEGIGLPGIDDGAATEEATQVKTGARAEETSVPAEVPPSSRTDDVTSQVARTARGVIRPVAQARVGTLTGGVVSRLEVGLGDAVRGQQEIARVTSSAGDEVLTAPWPGTITSILVQVGDTVVPGTVIATVSDLTRLQVETTDVDEFLIGQIYRGQAVTIDVAALDGRVLHGRVRSVGLEPRVTEAGDEHYPVVIDLIDPVDDLHLGMTVRVTFLE